MVEKKSIELLIDNGTVVTIDKDRRVIRHGAVAIKKNKIKEVGKARLLKAKYSAKRVYDAKNKLITPGLINSHLHFYHLFFDKEHIDFANHHFCKNKCNFLLLQHPLLLF